MPLIPGLPYPLGATLRDGGVNFAVASDHATAIDLCTFDESGVETCERLPGHDEGVWHGFLPGAEAGLHYGFRAHGPYAPARGLLFNPSKLLLDPYAREIVGEFAWDDVHYGHVRGGAELPIDLRDNAATMIQARVAAPLPGTCSPPIAIPPANTVIYELHVKGFSKLNPAIPQPLRGTYAGLAHSASVAHLRKLGITTVELLPVHYALSERRLVELGLSNYWGYNPIAWFCPDPRWSSTPDDPTATRAEFRAMVATLHAAGIEVVLDVVFNHDAEGGETGPTLSLRGLDETLYHRHGADGRCVNWTGCGNTLNFQHPRVVQLTLDSLRYWVEEFGVDGFRFDLAPILGRGRVDFDVGAPLLVALAQDPTLARVKLIAEPWDVGPHGYRLGGFPQRWLEWNDRYRDVPFRGHEGQQLARLEDPLARFFELEAAFDADRGFFGDHVPLRLVAANLVLSPGDAAQIAVQVRSTTEQLRKLLSLFSDVVPSIQLLMAAVLLQRGDQPAAFVAEVERVRQIMRKLGLRRREIYETVAILALRIRNELAPISEAQVERLRDIYEQMKRHHWLLTGPEDYPACAFLVGQRDRSPEQIGQRANAIYEGLREQAKLWRGDPLQTASNMLALSPLEPDELVERFRLLAVAFDQGGVRIRQGEYDEVAVLCFLARPTERIIETVIGYRDAIRERLRWADRSTAFGLAANLAFVRLVGNDPELGALADAKTLLDMQTIVAARQAAAAAAAAGSA